MPKLIHLVSKQGDVLVEVASPGGPGGRLEAAGLRDDILEKVEVSLDEVARVARVVAASFAEVAKGSAKATEVEFGLQISGKGNIFVVESNAQASIKVKFSF